MNVEIVHAATLAEACAMLGDGGAETRLVAGGTDLVVQMKRGRFAVRKLVDIRRIGDLRDIRIAEDGITIGALATQKMIERHPVLRREYPDLVSAAAQVGGHQVRNAATIGGNICNASPAADLLPPLLAAEAEIVLRSQAGERRLKVGKYLKGPGLTDRQPDEILTEIRLPRAGRDGCGAAFIKMGRRNAMEISVVSLAARIFDGEDGSRRIRLAAGAVGPTAMRLTVAEAFVHAHGWSDAALEGAGRAAADEVAPIDDVRASARFRRHLVARLVKRAAIAASQAGGMP